MRQTYYAKGADIQPQWRHVDAEGKRLGRLATEVATVLMGKHRPEYTPHVDTGDFVIITNADKIVMTGNKARQRIKSSYSGFAGGIKYQTYEELLERRPEFVVTDAVKRMLPKGPLGRRMLKKLRVFAGPEHPHQAQQPVEMKVGARGH